MRAKPSSNSTVTRYRQRRSKRQYRLTNIPWVWLLSGVVIGLLISLPIHKYSTPSVNQALSDISTNAHVADSHSETTNEVVLTQPIALKAPRFEFYDILQGEASKTPYYNDNAPIATSEKALPNTNNITPIVNELHTTIARDPPPGSYIIQVASFQAQHDAATLQNRLQYLGINSAVQTARVNNRTWFRIRVGPFESKTEAQAIHKQLLQHSLEAIILKF